MADPMIAGRTRADSIRAATSARANLETRLAAAELVVRQQHDTICAMRQMMREAVEEHHTLVKCVKDLRTLAVDALDHPSPPWARSILARIAWPDVIAALRG